MGNIKINGNDKELTNLSQDQTLNEVQDSESKDPEFKVDSDLLKIPEANPIKKIHNLS